MRPAGLPADEDGLPLHACNACTPHRRLEKGSRRQMSGHLALMRAGYVYGSVVIGLLSVGAVFVLIFLLCDILVSNLRGTYRPYINLISAL